MANQWTEARIHKPSRRSAIILTGIPRLSPSFWLEYRKADVWPSQARASHRWVITSTVPSSKSQRCPLLGNQDFCTRHPRTDTVMLWQRPHPRGEFRCRSPVPVVAQRSRPPWAMGRARPSRSETADWDPGVRKWRGAFWYGDVCSSHHTPDKGQTWLEQPLILYYHYCRPGLRVRNGLIIARTRSLGPWLALDGVRDCIQKDEGTP